MNTVRDFLAQSHVFAGLPEAVLDEVAGCGRLDHFDAGATVIHVGQPAGTFHVIRHGRVSIEIAAPGREPLVVATRGEGDAIGWSWLFKPYRWHFDATALVATRVISLDGECLRGKCAIDHRLGFHLMSRFAAIAIRDLESTQLQLLDVYGHVATR
jgi:CRP/FNR family transcriptional regulator, cyclic AMP receptor protein